MPLTSEQHAVLLRPLNGSRIAKRQQAGRSLSYLEAWDVKAHMTRIFGFCNWDGIVSDVRLAFEEEHDGKWSVGYSVTVTLAIRDQHQKHLCTYAEAAVGTATLPRRGEAHDMALKTAESDAFKRAAINLGTQFGLSLYNNGSTSDVIRATLVQPGEDAPATPDKAPLAAEQPDPAPQEGQPATPAPDAVLTELSEAARITDNGKRILAVASIKAQHGDEMQRVTEVDDATMTVGRYADLIAAGAYTGGES